MKYFRKELKGLNADVDRHRVKESQLRSNIAELEAKGDLDHFDKVMLSTYRDLLSKLLQSKAEVVNKIGKK